MVGGTGTPVVDGPHFIGHIGTESHECNDHTGNVVEMLDGSSNVTEHEFLASSDKSSTAGQSIENVDDEGFKTTGKRENVGTAVVSIRLGFCTKLEIE